MSHPVAPDPIKPQLTVPRNVIVRDLGHSDYWPVFEAMQAFTHSRQEHTPDELWLVEHPPVFTQGLSGKPEHVLAPGGIPVIPVDRGGQVTYHGPGQIVVYVMLDVRRAHWGPRQLITRMEQAVINLLAGYGINAYARPDAPGVYVDNAKLASLGLRIRRGCSYHGLSLNVAMDLEPFRRINPCGYPGLQVTQLQDLGIEAALAEVRESLLAALVASLEYTTIHRVEGFATFAEQETEHVRT